jgi:hypothetical protein
MDQTRNSSLDGSCEHGNDLSGYVRGEKYTDQLSNYQFTNQTLLYGAGKLLFSLVLRFETDKMSSSATSLHIIRILPAPELWQFNHGRPNCSEPSRSIQSSNFFKALSLFIFLYKDLYFLYEKSLAKNAQELHSTDQEIRHPFHTPIKIGWNQQI